jgi:hypothetical protein
MAKAVGRDMSRAPMPGTGAGSDPETSLRHAAYRPAGNDRADRHGLKRGCPAGSAARAAEAIEHDTHRDGAGKPARETDQGVEGERCASSRRLGRGNRSAAQRADIGEAGDLHQRQKRQDDENRPAGRTTLRRVRGCARPGDARDAWPLLSRSKGRLLT